jgi:hypothetical protein
VGCLHVALLQPLEAMSVFLGPDVGTLLEREIAAFKRLMGEYVSARSLEGEEWDAFVSASRSCVTVCA